MGNRIESSGEEASALNNIVLTVSHRVVKNCSYGKQTDINPVGKMGFL